jgi:hypothetical protein
MTEPRFGTLQPFEDDPRCESRGGPLVARVPLLGQHHEHPQRVVQADVLELSRRRVDEPHVLGQQRPTEARMWAALARHEHMFACYGRRDGGTARAIPPRPRS